MRGAGTDSSSPNARILSSTGERAATSSISSDRFDPAITAPLPPADAAVFETFVVPQYLRLFGELAVEMMTPPKEPGTAIVAHLGCRTGYPERLLVERLGPIRLVGTDASPAALELARAKATAIAQLSADYRLFEEFPTPLPPASFTHALLLHPRGRASSRRRLEVEATRLLEVGGEVAVALPLRGSFTEVMDLLREHATKFDLTHVGEAIDHAIAARPSPEALADELEAAGFVDVDVEFRPTTLTFQSGRDFFEHPASRLLLMPEWKSQLGLDDASHGAAFQYVREAFDRYFAEGGLEITVLVGAARGRWGG